MSLRLLDNSTTAHKMHGDGGVISGQHQEHPDGEGVGWAPATWWEGSAGRMEPSTLVSLVLPLLRMLVSPPPLLSRWTIQSNRS